MDTGFFTVAQYQRLIENGVLTPDDKVELFENRLVHREPRDPPHDGTVGLVAKELRTALPPGWDARCLLSLELPDSQPEPDFAIVREDPADYTTRHPTQDDTALVIEVANATLHCDQTLKTRIYARAGVAVYWIINLVDRRVEVYSQPSGATAAPSFATVQTYSPGDTIPLVLDGNAIAIPVNDLLP